MGLPSYTYARARFPTVTFDNENKSTPVRATYLLERILDNSLRRAVHMGTTKIERYHKIAKHLAFGAGGHLRSNEPADQEKAIVYYELVTNTAGLRNVVRQTQALNTRKSTGICLGSADLAFLSQYANSKLKRFGNHPADLNPDAMATRTDLLLQILIKVPDFARILPADL